MNAAAIEIKAYHDTYRQSVLTVWEQSVLATHHFLTESDFEEIRQFVQAVDFNDLQVFCLIENESVLGFIGVADRKVEMLFVHPTCFGKGFGQRLLRFAISELKANKVDVNEQNSNAVHFYKKFGFEILERTDKDDQGRSYPLLRLQLASG